MRQLWERFWRFLKKLIRQKDSKKVPEQESHPGPVHPETIPDQKTADKTAPLEKEPPLSGFPGQAKAFSGLYEALYLAQNHSQEARCRDVLQEWRIRLVQMNGTPFAENILHKISKAEQDEHFVDCAAWLLKQLFHAGIVRDNRKIVSVEELDILRYGSLDGRTLQCGESVSVLLPCWYCGDLLLERGMVS